MKVVIGEGVREAVSDANFSTTADTPTAPAGACRLSPGAIHAARPPAWWLKSVQDSSYFRWCIVRRAPEADHVGRRCRRAVLRHFMG